MQDSVPVSSEDMKTPLYQSGQERFMNYLHDFFENEEVRNKINNAKNNKEVLDVIAEARDFIPGSSK